MELYKVYNEVTFLPHGYLLFDLTQSTNDLFRFRTDILNNDFSTCYTPAYLLDPYLCKKETIGGAKTYAVYIYIPPPPEKNIQKFAKAPAPCQFRGNITPRYIRHT